MTASLNWVDYCFLAIFLFSTFAGFGRGFVRELVSLGALVAAFVIASLFSNALATYFTHTSSVQGMMGQASNAIGVDASHSVSYIAIGISFSILFAGTLIAGAIFGFFINLAFQTGMLGLGNRLFGAVFGLARGFIINLVLIFVIQLTPLNAQSWWHESAIVKAYQPAVQWLGNIVSPALSGIKEKFDQTMQGINSTIQQGVESIKDYQ